jgi:uncharacterized protein YjbI with pentapeptide repeats
LQEIKLPGANLSGANLFGADLGGANLTQLEHLRGDSGGSRVVSHWNP